MRMMIFYAFLALGLLLDGARLFRMCLFSAALHELGHVAAYFICTGRLPTLRACAGGISLHRTVALTRGQEIAVLAAGPGVNFLLSAVLCLRAQVQASYAVYFLAAVNLCVGCYNLLPISALDGAQLLQQIVPAHRLPAVLRLQRILFVAFCLCLPVLAFVPQLSGTLRVAAVLAPGYLLLQSGSERFLG